MDTERPKTLDSYIKAMQERNVEVIPTINRANKLQGFRFQYQGHNFKASEVHRSMSGGRIMAQLSQNKGIAKPKEIGKSVQLLGKTVEMSTNLATGIAKNIIKKTIKRAIDTGNRIIKTQEAMGYKKLDEVMELLTDELDGFNKSIVRLERLTQNTDNIKVIPDTSEIERLLQEHLNSEKVNTERLQESVQDISNQISKARLVPKIQLWFHYSIWLISLIIIGYLSLQVSRIGEVQEKAFTEGEQEVISNLRRLL